MEKKNNKGIIIALCTVIIVLIGAIAFMFISGTVSFNAEKKETGKTEEKEDNNKIEESENEEDKVERLELNSSIVQALYEYVYAGDYSNTTSYFRSNLFLTNKTVIGEEKLRVALVTDDFYQTFQYLETNDSDCGGASNKYTLDGNSVVERINKIFGNDNEYKHITKDLMLEKNKTENYDCGLVKYNDQNNNYEMSDSCGCGGAYEAYRPFYKLISAEKTKDYITLTEKMYVAVPTNSLNTNIYKDLAKTQLIASEVDEKWYGELNEDYLNQGTTTTFTFKLAEEGNYYFESSKVNY